LWVWRFFSRSIWWFIFEFLFFLIHLSPKLWFYIFVKRGWGLPSKICFQLLGSYKESWILRSQGFLLDFLGGHGLCFFVIFFVRILTSLVEMTSGNQGPMVSIIISTTPTTILTPSLSLFYLKMIYVVL